MLFSEQKSKTVYWMTGPMAVPYYFKIVCLMKKILNILCASATIVLALASCQKDIDQPQRDGIRFHSGEIKTKTAFGTLSAGKYPTLWTSTNDIKISENKANSVSATVAPTSGGTTAEFTPASKILDDGTSSYVFYALSPASAQVSHINTSYNSWNVEIPANQTPLDGSVDESAQVLFAKYNSGSTFPSDVNFEFTHVTAYGKFSLANLALDPGETVNSITLTSPENWVGRWYYYVEDNTNGNNAGDFVASSASNTINLTTNKTTDIWFACAPVDLGGQDIEVTVTTTKGTFTRSDVTIPAGKKFEAGHVAQFGIDMTGVTRSGGVVYTLIDDVDDLTLNSEIIIVNPSQSKAAGVLGSNTYFAAQSVTISGSTISDPSSSVEVFKIANGNIAGTYALKAASKDDKYVKNTSGTSLDVSTTLDNAGSWAIAIDGSANASIRNMSEVTRYLLSNSSSGYRITAYIPGASTESVSIYKKNGTGSGAITPKTVTGLTISGATTSYLINDTYSFDGTVKVNYSDLSSKVLTSSEYTVNSSAVNMAAAGTYTVTVSLVADPLVSTTYDVTVSTSTKLLVYTLTTPKGTSNNNYASTYTVTISGVDWKAPGNQNWDGFWRIGGKSLSGVDRVIYGIGSIAGDVDEIVINTNGISNANLTVNSITVTVYDSSSNASSGTSPIATFTTTGNFEFSAGTEKSLTFTKSGSTSCAGKYYRFAFNVSNSKTSNYGLDLTSIEFYKN